MKPSHQRANPPRHPILTTCLALAIPLGSTFADSVTVTGATDVVDGNVSSISALDGNRGPDGLISLREAVSAANHTAGADTILFDASLDGVPIVLSLAGTGENANADGDLDFTDPAGVTLAGNGAANTILDGNADERVLDGREGSMTLAALTVRNGFESSSTGGGILQDGLEFTATDCVISGNTGNNGGGFGETSRTRYEVTFLRCQFLNNVANREGGGLRVDNDCMIDGCLFSGNRTNRFDGGGLAIGGGSEVPATIRNSVFTGNHADGSGGAITHDSSDGAMTLDNCSIVGNTADGDGGGIDMDGDTFVMRSSTVANNSAGGNGGGIWHEETDETLVIFNSTISGNRADGFGGGIGHSARNGAVTLEFCTITANVADDDDDGTGDGGGIDIDSDSGTTADVRIRNSIIQGNLDGTTGQSGAEDGSISGGVGAFVTQGGNVFGSGTGISPGANDTTGSAALGALADNGGTTQTHALLAGSAAIDFTTTEPELLDQRGVGRFDASPDAGAFEAGTGSITVTTANDVVDGTTTSLAALEAAPGADLQISLREALTAANNTAGRDAIFFSPSIDGQPIVLSLSPTSDDANLGGDLDITDAGGLSIVGNGPRQTLIDADGRERAIDHFGGDLSLVGMTVRNGVDGDAGGIQSFSPTPAKIAILRTHWVNNVGDDAGGALYISGLSFSRVDIIDSEFRNNLTFGSIGAGAYLSVRSADITVSGSTFTANNAEGNGGGIYSNAQSLLVENSTFTANTSNAEGGGIYTTNTNGSTTIRDTRFTLNQADDGGGAAVTGTGEMLTVEKSIFDQNTAFTDSGGLHMSTSSGVATVDGTTFSNNTATANGGGLGHRSGSSSFLTLTNSTVSGNRANGSGGGIVLDSFNHTLTLNHVTVTGNIADDDADGSGQGGGLAIIDEDQSVFNLRNSIVQGNDDETPAQLTSDDCGNTGSQGTFVSLGSNVFGSGTGCPVGANDTTGNANLLPLSRSDPDDFRRFPDTHRLGQDSAAWNIASASAVVFDQRGYARTDGLPDAGAVETQFRVPSNYFNWVTASGLTPGVNDGLFADPNGDGTINLEHWAFDEDPLGNGSSDGKSAIAVVDAGGQDYLSLTIPVSEGVSGFQGSPLTGNTVGASYVILGDDDLSGNDIPVVELTPALDDGLPALSDVNPFASGPEWSYRTFRLSTPVVPGTQGFLKVRVQASPNSFEFE